MRTLVFRLNANRLRDLHGAEFLGLGGKERANLSRGDARARAT
jgi:hypothetical protein